MADQRDEMVEALLVASRAIIGIAVRSLAASGADVSVAQFRALVVLSADGPHRVVDIAGELATSPSAAARMCERLVRKGLLDRRRIGSDRREVQLSLTDEGHRVVMKVIDLRRAELAAVVGMLPERTLWPAVAMLRQLATAAGEPTGDAGWQDWHS